MKRFALGAMAVLALAACSNEEEVVTEAVTKEDFKEIEAKLLTMQNELRQASTDLTRTEVKLYELEEAAQKPKVTGAQLVNAAELYVRAGAGTEHQPLAIALYNAKLEVVDSSSAWYKVKISFEGLTKTEEENLIVYSDANGVKFKVYKNQLDTFNKLNESGQLYVHGHFITQTEDVVVAKTEVPANPKKPFVYGLTFYDFATKEIMEKKIWNAMQTDLTAKGFDGIQVVNVERDTFKEDMAAGKYQAVENAPGDLVIANENPSEPALIAFAKTVDETTRNDFYRGIVIVHKDSGITNFDDLKGRKIATGKEYSESGFKYQNYYLNKMEDINIKEEATLVQDYTHQETLFVVATGKLEAGFVGDFVLTDPYHELQYGASQVGVDLKSESQLNELREQVIVLPYDASMNVIPNNPHSLQAELAKDEAFLEKLHKVVELIYAENKEGFDLTEAKNEEYEFLREFQTTE